MDSLNRIRTYLTSPIAAAPPAQPPDPLGPPDASGTVAQPPPQAGVPTTPLAQNPTTRTTIAAPSSNSSTILSPGSFITMPKPIMGDLTIMPDGSSIAWCGGIPLLNWTGLVPSTKPVPTPTMHRNVGAKDSKAYSYRIAPTEIKFGPKDDVRAFRRKIFTHLQLHGMDTISYLPDPAQPTVMESVVEKPDLFTKTYVSEKSVLYYSHYDDYDKLNDRTATTFLLASLNPELERKVTEALATTQNPSFVITWVTLMEKVRILTVGRVDTLQKQIENRKATDFAGQNIETMAELNIRDALDLQQAGWHNQSTLYQMVRNFAQANTECPEYQLFANRILLDYKEALEECFHKSSTEAVAYMISKNLSCEDVCNKFIRYYRAAIQDNYWLPAKNVRDRHGAPNNFANRAQRANNLVQLPPRAPQRVTNNTNQRNRNGRNSNNNSNNSNRSTSTNNSERSWVRVAPKHGESETKMMHGKQFMWCNACNRWTTTHSTAQHRSKTVAAPTRQPPNNGPPNSASVAYQPQVNLMATNNFVGWHCVPCKPEKENILVSIIKLVSTMVNWFATLLLPTVACIAITIGILGFIHSLPFLIKVQGFLGYGILAPISWIVSLLAFAHLQPVLSQSSPVVSSSSDSDSSKMSRRQRRWIQKQWKIYLKTNKNRRPPRAQRATRPPTGIQAPTPPRFHRSYPHRLRSRNLYRQLNPSTVVQIRNERAQRVYIENLPAVAHHRCRRTQHFQGDTMLQENNQQLLPPAISPAESFARQRKWKQERKQRNKQQRPFYKFVDSLPLNNNDALYISDNIAYAGRSALADIGNQVKMYRSPNDMSRIFRQTSHMQPYDEYFKRREAVNPSAHVLQVLNAPTAKDRILNFVPEWFRKCFTLQPNKRTVVWDSGASISISPNRDDFVGPIDELDSTHTLKGINDVPVQIKGKGYVSWTFESTNGMLRTIKLPCLYVPAVNQRLLSTTSLLHEYPDEHIDIGNGKFVLRGSSDPKYGPIAAYIDPSNNLPTSDIFDHTYTYKYVDEFNSLTTVVDKDNYNLSEPEKELLRWHQRLAHVDFNKVKFLFRTGILARGEGQRALQTAASKLKFHPRCAACQFGKQTRRSVPTTTGGRVSDSVGSISRNVERPGQCISVDHFVCKTKGRLFTSRGKTPENDMYSGGCVFVDNYSGYIHVEMQKNLNTHETLQAKHKFEQMALDVGVIPQTYLSDNGTAFTSHEFANRMKQFHQVSRFAGAGAHHHNGIAERSIRTVISIARTMMMHAAIHWPEVSDPQLWPMAVSYASYIYNRMPNVDTGLSPYDTFTKLRWKQSQLHDMHVWGCPVYVLDKRIADGIKIPKWAPRANRFIYMGVSEKHSSTVPLLLNPETGVISPQFHVVIDEWFATIPATVGEQPDFNSDVWQKMFGESRYQFTWDENGETDDETVDESNVPTENNVIQTERTRDAMEEYVPPTPLPVPEPSPTRSPTPNRFPANSPGSVPKTSTTIPTGPPRNLPFRRTMEPSPITPQRLEQREQFTPSPPQSPAMAPTNSPSPSVPAQSPVQLPSSPVQVPPSIPEPQALRRSERTRRPPDRLNLYTPFPPEALAAPCDFPQPLLFNSQHPILNYLTECLLSTLPNLYSASQIGSSFAFKAALGDPDTYTWDEAMHHPLYADEFRKAALKEIQALEKHGTWEVDDIANALARILPGTWVFRIKRAPDGTILKFKARYCVRGDLQDDDPETFAPVVAWSTIRLFTILSLILTWRTKSIDFSQAFVQAFLKQPVWIHLPRGFIAPGGGKVCLKLVKSLYGLSEAPRLWYLHLFDALVVKLGFTQSAIDPCLLLKPNMMMVIFVDDCAISYRYDKDYYDLITNLHELGFELTEEGDFTKFLGINFTRTPKSITMTQTGLIDRIAATTGLTHGNPNRTPTVQDAIGKDLTGPPMKEEWSYRSVVGMLLYLATNTRPDIAYAVSQVARFSNNPKQSHATAVKTIVRYLIGTRTMGTIVTPTGKLDINLYVDADFAGLYKREHETDADSARSRTGYIITLGGFPLIWKSQLQTEISLSTLEAEYSALSSSIRALIPIREQLFEIAEMIKLPSELVTSIVSRVFEDNQGAFLLGNNQRITARTRYYLVKYHHFWVFIRMEEGNKRKIYLLKCSTDEQGADFLTKGLSRIIFERNRMKILGW